MPGAYLQPVARIRARSASDGSSSSLLRIDPALALGALISAGETYEVVARLASGFGTIPRPAEAGGSRLSLFHGFRSPLANSTRGYSPRPRRGRTSEVFYRARFPDFFLRIRLTALYSQANV